MPAVTRKGDLDTGHDACPPHPSIQGSSDVFVNKKAAHRQGDEWGVHGCPVHAPHGAILSSGSGTVFVNGKALGRIGDPVSCGSSVATGSGDVFAG